MSKFALRALTEALEGELAAGGVAVQLVTPGFVDSEIRSVDNQGEYLDTCSDPVPKWLRVRTDAAARAIADGITARRREIVISGHCRVGILLARWTPSLVRFLVRHGMSPAFSPPQRDNTATRGPGSDVQPNFTRSHLEGVS
jgi:short-subunit dehydrogenase